MANKYQKYVNTPSGATDYQTREAQRKYGSGVTYKNGQLYADGRSFASEADLLKYQQGQTKLGDFYRDLSRYNAEQNKYTEQLRNRFKSQAELAGAQATRGTMAQTNQFLQRRGIDSTRGGLAASLQNETTGRIQGQVAAANMGFSAQLSSLMQQQHDAFVNKEFDFFHRMDIMGYEAELQKDIMRYQAQLQADSAFNQLFQGIMGIGGSALMAWAPWAGGGASAAAGTGGTALRQSDRFQYMYGLD